jgi:K+-transporting ATPase ATPase C chain
MKKIIKTSFLITIVFIVLCGIVYPLAITVIGQIAFNKGANGSLVSLSGKTVGSELIGQEFKDPRFFKGRLSAVSYNTYTLSDKKPDKTGTIVYNGVNSGGSNLAPSNKVLEARVKKDINEFLKEHPTIKESDIPTDLLTSSGSGLDPDISPQAAEVQIDAVSKASGISKSEIRSIVKEHTDGRTFKIFGESRVNVLMVNIEIAQKLKDLGKL